MKDILDRFNGKRVETTFRCSGCGCWDGVLRRHYCRDELELFCDRCETWHGVTVTRDDVRAWSRSQLLPTLPSPEAA
jgi:hypothetical protein